MGSDEEIQQKIIWLILWPCCLTWSCGIKYSESRKMDNQMLLKQMPICEHDLRSQLDRLVTVIFLLIYNFPIYPF